MFLQFFQVVGLISETVQFQQTGQWQYDGLMAIAQLHSRLAQLDAAVGLFYHFPQQISLGIGLMTVVQQRWSISVVPPGILHLPELVLVFIRKEVQEVHLVADTGVLLHQGSLQQVVVQPHVVHVFLHIY